MWHDIAKPIGIFLVIMMPWLSVQAIYIFLQLRKNKKYEP